MYSGKEGDRHELGVGFVVENSMKENIIDFKPVNERICVLRVKTKFFNLSLINVHAESEDKDEAVKDEFYCKLEQTYNSMPSNDIKMILGDMNAKIGKEMVFQRVAGLHSLHEESNDNGMRVLDFAMSRNMIVASTQFPRKEIHKWTWTSPDGQHHNQIDHVLVDRRAATSITNIRSCRGADCDSDHYLVRIDFRCRIRSKDNKRQQRPPKLNVDKLREEGERKKYQEALENLIQLPVHAQEENRTTEEEWQDLKRAITQAAEETIGYSTQTRRESWFDDECEEAIQKRNEARRHYIERPTRAKKANYDILRRKAKSVIKRKKREYYNNKVTKIQQDFEKKDPREAYKGVNLFKKGYKPKTTLCKDLNGKIIGNKDSIMERWRTYFSQLLNPNLDQMYCQTRD
ncbi:uncharacterized protein LOC120354375 [Nilaparvata lugens]|uniref:uncharacterized protein LOC120354375 n=1 Tax=Nilaparvata lugens TaxID=108931 RepID=UPI00193D17FA|nr:uncharacterized protein LOC120354375 [Nilaparvata lugens]